jgi:4-amino-4-deoxy-L-arabinose transferase-like glycosyltransferase
MFTRKRQAGLAVLVGLALRLGVVVGYPVRMVGDQTDYDQLGLSLASGMGYGHAGIPTALRAPGYPAFVALVYLVAGHHPAAVAVAQAVIGAGLVLLTYLAVRDHFGHAAALISAWLVAIYPTMVFLTGDLLSENLSVVLVLALVWVCGRLAISERGTNWRLVATAAITLAAATYVRPSTAFVFIVCAAFAILAERVGRRAMIARFAGAIVLALLLLSPWVIRNHRLFGGWTLATEQGITLYISYWPVNSNGKIVWGNEPPANDPRVASIVGSTNEVVASGRLTSYTLTAIGHNPGLALRLAPVKIETLLIPKDYEMIPGSAPAVLRYEFIFVLAGLVVLALIVPLVGDPVTRLPSLLWCGVIAAVLVTSVVVYGGPRLRIPIDLAVFVLAGAGVSRVLTASRARGQRG